MKSYIGLYLFLPPRSFPKFGTYDVNSSEHRLARAPGSQLLVARGILSNLVHVLSLFLRYTVSALCR